MMMVVVGAVLPSLVVQDLLDWVNRRRP